MVLGRVVRLRREAVVEILVVSDEVVATGAGGFQGVVRAQDVRATEKDRVKVGEMFRVGDIVRGLVVSLIVWFFGDAGSTLHGWKKGDGWEWMGMLILFGRYPSATRAVTISQLRGTIWV